VDPASLKVRLLLLEPRDSPFAARIEGAAGEAGLSVSYLDSVESAPSNAALIGVGPSYQNPLQVARHFRAHGARPLLIFFAASASSRDAVQAELVRDPFLYPRYELVELQDNARQLATRMGRVVAEVTRGLHAVPSHRRRRSRPRSQTPLPRLAAKAEHYLAHVLAQTPDAILSTDETGRVESWNDASERLFGFRADSVFGRPVGFLDVADAEHSLGAVVKAVLMSGEPHKAQFTCATNSGVPVRVGASVAPIRDRQGTILGVSVFARDDTEYQRFHEAMREANRQKDEFLAIMSHELRTPLTSILGYTDMLLRGLSGPLAPMANKYVGNVRSAGDRLLEIVNGLLDYTRLEAGAERLELRPVDVRRVVTQTVQQWQAAATSKGIELELLPIPADTPGRIHADEERLTHVLRCYLNNALKFTPSGGWVGVHVGPDPDQEGAIRVAVTDSGIGLRVDQIDRVWERFYQGDSSLTKPYGGMGLGLAIAKHLAALHQGTVGAESSGPGQGSTFWFSLPGA
jgi:PAS domain S-box-containing protein